MAEKLTTEEIDRLIAAARQAREKAYAPYSGFLVGAAVLGVDGQIYTGCNIENASYGLTNCAERTAIFKAVSEGNREFRALALFTETEQYCPPCGACRQVMAEFGDDILVIRANNRGQYLINTSKELLPAGFTAGTMAKETNK